MEEKRLPRLQQNPSYVIIGTWTLQLLSFLYVMKSIYPQREREMMAQKLFSLTIPVDFPRQRQLLDKDILNRLDFNGPNPRSLVPLVSDQSWLIFHMLGHKKGETQWMKIPAQFQPLNDFYLEFVRFVKNIEVVNDSSERAIKMVQELIDKAQKEEKRQDTFLFTHAYKRNKRGRKKVDLQDISIQGVSQS